eukprot:CAMPEP_0198122902 /NCGR_PEP_ID=MMETSP1442-20131203/36127_1 /TAXON_ID= /ORGANISM="Craspedostauros australis, Strain CCMP3328" /LENGTH=94 /DNA_ID=CAMNT_0043782009 /DNA_START=333 /DNA_END=614 /DNA_ORIENTATION=-
MAAVAVGIAAGMVAVVVRVGICVPVAVDILCMGHVQTRRQSFAFHVVLRLSVLESLPFEQQGALDGHWDAAVANHGDEVGCVVAILLVPFRTFR